MPNISLSRRIEALEKENYYQLKALVEAKYGPTFDRFVISLTDDELIYREKFISGKLPESEQSSVIDWTIEAKIYQAFELEGVEVPDEIQVHLEAVEKELGLKPAPGTKLTDRVNNVVAVFQEAG